MGGLARAGAEEKAKLRSERRHAKTEQRSECRRTRCVIWVQNRRKYSGRGAVGALLRGRLLWR